MKTRNFSRILIVGSIFMAGLVFSGGFAQDIKSDQKVTSIAELKKYEITYIEGTVTKILDEDEFRIEDSSGDIKVYTGWKNTNTVKKDEKVKVKGYLDPGLIKEFYATEIIRENGERLVLKADE